MPCVAMAPKKDKAPPPPPQINPVRPSPASADDTTTSIASDDSDLDSDASASTSSLVSDGSSWSEHIIVMKPCSPMRAWTADDELTLLKAVVVHKHMHKRLPSPEDLVAELRGRLRAEDGIDAEQVARRLKALRSRYTRTAIRLSRGNTVKGDDLTIYNFSKLIWSGTRRGEKEKEEEEEKKARTADARQDPRGFDELVGLYPCLAAEVDAVDAACATGVLKRAFGRIDDDTAARLEAKAKRQQVAEVRASEKLGSLRMSVLRTLLQSIK